MGHGPLGPGTVVVLLGMELKINARGSRGILEVYRFRLTCVGFGRSRDATECRITRVVFLNVLAPWRPAAEF